MGIYPQPNAWLCGPFALKHALLALGVFENEWAIARAAGSDPGGTDERELARAARQFDCSLRMIRVHYPEDARQELVHHLEQGKPVLLCIEQWDHWVTAMHHEDNQFVLFDSRGQHVIRVLGWDELRPKWEFKEASGSLLYDLHPVVAHIRMPRPQARFSVGRARWLANPSNAGLARQWSDYGRVLLELGQPSHGDNRDLFARPMTDVLVEQGDTLSDQVMRQVGRGVEADTEQVLLRLHFVAGAYDLSVSREREAELTAVVREFVISRLQVGRAVGS